MDKKLDKVIADINYILSSLISYRDITRTGCCNDCENRGCGYIPRAGQTARYNCPHYEKFEDGIKLDPCPFCGGNDCEIRTDDHGLSFYVFRKDCGVSVGYSTTLKDAASAWNMREKEATQ